VKNSTWDIVAWNHAASVVLADYAALPVEQRNGLRLVFCNPRVRTAMLNWESDARFAVAAFRADIARAGAARNIEALVEDLSRLSPEFAAMWRDQDVRSTYGEGPKHLRHPRAGRIALEYSAFAVDGRPDLSLVIYNPATSADADKIRLLVKPQTSASIKSNRPRKK
jgi:MmyB-like transcription regulator ligand binding domain